MSGQASEAAIERGEALVEAERVASIARSTALMTRPGTTHCEDCGEETDAERRKAAPFARRCLDCQTIFERKTRRV